MRFRVPVHMIAALAAGLGAGAALAAGDAEVQSDPGTQAVIDDHGNLIVYHASGYKQIIVGGAGVLERSGVTVDELFEEVPHNNGGLAIITPGDAGTEAPDGVNLIRPAAEEGAPIVHDGKCYPGTTAVVQRNGGHKGRHGKHFRSGSVAIVVVQHKC